MSDLAGYKNHMERERIRLLAYWQGVAKHAAEQVARIALDCGPVAQEVEHVPGTERAQAYHQRTGTRDE